MLFVEKTHEFDSLRYNLPIMFVARTFDLNTATPAGVAARASISTKTTTIKG